MLVPLLALGFFCLVTTLRTRRVLHVSAVGQPAASSLGWRPRLIVPGHLNESYKWLDQTNQMFALGEWRVRHVDYENAPMGHDVNTASPYRWWLGALALGWNAATGSSIGPSIEWAALLSDPLLLVLLGSLTVVVVARRFGGLAAALLSAGLVALYPFASEFVPGAPDDRGLTHLLAFWSVLPLLCAVARDAGEANARSRRRAFFAAGVLGGVGLWISPPGQVPVILGIAAGALISAWALRPRKKDPAGAPGETLPWRAWALGGALMSLAAYLVEFFPASMGSWELRAIHPVYGIAWLGLGELLARASAKIQGNPEPTGPRGWILSALSLAAVSAVPATVWLSHSTDYLMEDLSSTRLSLLQDSPSAESLWSWLLQNGFTATVWITLIPLLVAAPAIAFLILRSFSPGRRSAMAITLGPLGVALAFSLRELRWWNGVDSVILLLAVTVAFALETSPRRRLVTWSCAVAAALILLPGAVRVWPPGGGPDDFTQSEVVGLVERDMSYWLAQHVGQGSAIVLAPPNTTASLYYYGGIRGLGTFDWESRDGTRAAVRIVSALTPEEAQELIAKRGITHIVIPGWDPYLDAYARIGEGQVGGTFLERLHLWMLPAWIRPIPYLIPTISGFEGQSAEVMEIVDEQDDSTAASRMVEYLIDTGQMNLVPAAGKVLRRFPADLGALLAKAEISIAEGNTEEFTQNVDVLIRRLGGGAEQSLAWDQRVNLAVVLAQARHMDLARQRLKQCLDEVDEEKLRSLSTNSLYRLHVLRKALGLTIKDPSRLELSRELLPPDLRERLPE